MLSNTCNNLSLSNYPNRFMVKISVCERTYSNKIKMLWDEYLSIYLSIHPSIHPSYRRGRDGIGEEKQEGGVYSSSARVKWVDR